jgi:phosphate transport system protein
VLRVAPELERTHDLEGQIAFRAGRLCPEGLSPRSRSLIEQMGELAVDMWSQATDGWLQRDGSAAAALANANGEMRDLHASLTAVLAAGGMASSVTIEIALTVRFYGRLGDHAVNVARRMAISPGQREADRWALASQACRCA